MSSCSLTIQEYFARLLEYSSGVARLVSELCPGRHPEDHLEDWLAKTSVCDGSAVATVVLYDSEIPLAQRAALLAYTMEATPAYIKGNVWRKLYHRGWEETFMQHIDFNRLQPELQELAMELMLTWSVLRFKKQLKHSWFAHQSEIIGTDTTEKGLYRHMVGPILWAAQRSSGEKRLAYIRRLPWFPSDLRSPEVLFPGQRELLELPGVSPHDYIGFDTNIRCLLAERLAYEQKVRADYPNDSVTAAGPIWIRAYANSLLKTYTELPDNVLRAVLEWKDENGKQFVEEQLRFVQAVDWGEAPTSEVAPRYVFAFLGKLDRLDAMDSDDKGIKHSLRIMLWGAHLCLFGGMVRDAVQKVFRCDANYIPIAVDLHSADAQHGIGLVLDKKVKTIPESRHILDVYMKKIGSEIEA